MDDEIILKPCPFCGTEAFFDVWENGNVEVKCKDIYGCSCEMGLYDSKEEAAEKWNRRPLEN